jgi:hypothetical protein
MTYPGLEQYQEALQHPRTALLDPELRAGSISTSGLGLPLVMCGGFALTYTVAVGGKKYAVRCFHRASPNLEQRYQAISAKLTQLASAYFLPFVFEPQGVRIVGGTYPVVKMAWAKGDTLGDFVADNFRKKGALASLRNSLAALAAYLENQQIAHGDIQPGNVMVGDLGTSIQLIDYDGMYVPAIQKLGASETGHRNFQHPKRKSQFDGTLDRFSFICINVALRALEEDAKLWDESQADSDSFIFRASDFSDPGSSAIFQKLMARPAISSSAKSLAAIALSDFDKTPSLADFLVGRGIPQQQIVISAKPVAPSKYGSQYLVLDARDYEAFRRSVGSMVELVGQVTDVKRGFSKRGRGAYLFVNFGNWRGNIVKLTVWSSALPKVKDQVTQSLVGQWVSVVGLVEPPYVSRKFNYSHISIDITGPGQIRAISPSEAAFRLGSGARGGVLDTKKSVIERIRGGSAPVRVKGGQRATAIPPRSGNEAILQQMQRSQGSKTSRSAAPTSVPTAVKKLRGIPWWVWLLGVLVLWWLLSK